MFKFTAGKYTVLYSECIVEDLLIFKLYCNDRCNESFDLSLKSIITDN